MGALLGGMFRKQRRLPRYSVRSFVALPSADIEHFCGDIFFDQRASAFFDSIYLLGTKQLSEKKFLDILDIFKIFGIWDISTVSAAEIWRTKILILTNYTDSYMVIINS